MVWRLCWVRARGDYERCRDLVQEVSIALWLHLDKLRPGVSLQEEKAWVRWQTRTTLDHLHRSQRPPMVALTFVMLAILIFCDYYYDSRIIAALTRAESPIVPTGKNAFVATTRQVISVHRILLIIGAALFALLPVYSKLLRKINTSIEVAENKDMGTIDISGEDA